MPNRTEPKTVKQWITYLFMAAVAIWLIIWLLGLSGIHLLSAVLGVHRAV